MKTSGTRGTTINAAQQPSLASSKKEVRYFSRLLLPTLRTIPSCRDPTVRKPSLYKRRGISPILLLLFLELIFFLSNHTPLHLRLLIPTMSSHPLLPTDSQPSQLSASSQRDTREERWETGWLTVFPHVIAERQMELRPHLGTVLFLPSCFNAFPESWNATTQSEHSAAVTMRKCVCLPIRKRKVFLMLCEGCTSFCWSEEAGLSGPKKYFLSRYFVVTWEDLSCRTALSFWGVLLYCSKSSQHVRWMLCRNTNITFTYVRMYWTCCCFYLGSPGFLVLEERHKVADLMAVTEQGTEPVALVIWRHAGPGFRQMCFYKGSRMCNRREMWAWSKLLRLRRNDRERERIRARDRENKHFWHCWRLADLTWVSGRSDSSYPLWPFLTSWPPTLRTSSCTCTWTCTHTKWKYSLQPDEEHLSGSTVAITWWWALYFPTINMHYTCI